MAAHAVPQARQQTSASSSATAAASTCPALPPLSTVYPYVLPQINAKSVNGGRESFGPPNAPNGKNTYGQPKSWGKKPKVRSVIFTVPDGFGPASEAMARDYHQWSNGLDWNTQLPADTIQVGSVRTRSSDSYVTDSAAAATAYACAVKVRSYRC